jgi:alkylation response protein AidB-like acyl-CoA dehydrogenase
MTQPFAHADRTTGPPMKGARALTAEVRARASEIESARRLPSDLARKFAEAGLFRMMIPREFGGFESHPEELARVIEEVSCADGAAGWCVMIGATTAILSGLLPERAAREIYGTDPLVITAGAVAPTGTARASEGGYRVSGRWQWGSATENCQWIVGGCLLMDGDKRRIDASGQPQIALAVLRRDQVEILDTWNASGLRGTGSHDFRTDDAFVPADRMLLLVGGPEPAIKRPLYLFPFFGLLAVGVSAVMLGIARRAIDELVELAAQKTPTWERRTLAHSARVQSAVAEAEAALRSARAFLFDAIGAAWKAVERNGSASIEDRRDLRLATTNAAWQSAHAVDLMYNAGGGSSVHATSALQRCFRDVHVATQHRQVNASNYELAGRLYLGLDTPAAFL